MKKTMVLLLAFFSLGFSNPAVDLDAIKTIESGGVQRSFNKASEAAGLYQLTPIALKDYLYYSKDGGREIAEWLLAVRYPQILRSIGKPVTVDNLLICYNAGCGYVGKNLPKETVNYIKKYKELT